MERKQFLKAYLNVFGLTGEIMPCGREACYSLLTCCHEIDPSQTNYGNYQTCFLEIPAIKSLMNREFPEVISREKFLAVYLNVFSKDGMFISPRNYEFCRNLILLCQEGSSKLSYYGNIETGWLNVAAVKSFVAKNYPEIIFREHYFRVFDDTGRVINSSDEAILYLLVATTMVRPSSPRVAPLVSRFDPVSINKLYKEIFYNI